MEAIKLGIDWHKSGYNIFAIALNGTGKLTTVKQLLNIEAYRQPVPSDCLCSIL